MQHAETRCVITGGGPAGMMLGYVLARAGIAVTVLEKWPDFFRDFRGDTIHPSTMTILHELGILDDFLALPHSEMEQMAGHIGGEEFTLVDFRSLDSVARFIAFIPQWDFLNFLAEKAKAFPHFQLMMATDATDVIREGGRVVGVLAKDAQGAEVEIRAELVVGADGRHSTLREKAGFAVEELGVPIDVLWFRIAHEGADDKRSLGYIDAGSALVMLDRHEYWQCAFIIEKGGFDAIKARGLEAFRAKVAALAPVSAKALDEVDSWDKVKLLSVAVDHVRTWAQEGILLIGDAAHAMSPIGGVGINYAIHDAIAAANILVPALRAGDVSLPVLSRMQARREGPVRRMQRIQVFMQDKLMIPVLRRTEPLKLPFLLRLFQWFPRLRRIPARIIGIGFQPEHVTVRFEKE